MKNYITNARAYTATHKKELIEFAIGAIVVVGLIAAIVTVMSLVRNNQPVIAYQPSDACLMFTNDDAKTVLGDAVFNSSTKKPVISGNTATSNCGYTNGIGDKQTMLVAAVIVRSGINDSGVKQNKAEFMAGRPEQNVEIIKDVGDSAYYNLALGQLNVLSGRDWIIISNGPGAEPQANTIDDALKVAYKTLPAPVPVTTTF